MKELIKLEIGAGKKPRTDFITCDIRALKNVDVVCDTMDLPYDNETVSEIYSRHLIEHFSFKDFLVVLAEWNRVLKTDGEVYIICPNLMWHLNQIINGSHKSFFIKDRGKNDRYWGFGSLFGWQQDSHDFHKFGYYFELLHDILEVMGFGEIQNLTNEEGSMEKAPWHLEVKCKKIKNSPDPLSLDLYNHFDVNH
ncbi:MAG: hypothetical protein C0593_06540 [Marinilabiliales bacterium]|nr:MAG: hypothetical protein C0593_06540 [Marinilabiliales bacterium]